MRSMTRFLGLAVAGALVLVGGYAVPAQAAAPSDSVTKGSLTLAFRVPGLPAGSFTATKPAKVTAKGLVFPITGVAGGDHKRIDLGGLLGLDGVSTGVAFPIYAMLSAKDKELVLYTKTSQGPVTFFHSSGMTVTGPKTKVNAAKRIRTTTTVWKGAILVSDDPQAAAGLNGLFGVTSFKPGGSVGQMTLNVVVTAPCKNAACTK